MKNHVWIVEELANDGFTWVPNPDLGIWFTRAMARIVKNNNRDYRYQLGLAVGMRVRKYVREDAR